MAYTGLLACLSPRPKRTHTAHKTPLHAADSCSTALFEYDEAQRKHKTIETHHFSSPLARGGLGKCLSAPPIHIRRYQQETFKVLEGELGVIVSGKKQVVTPESGRVSIPAGLRHTFWPIEGPVNTRFEVTVDPDDEIVGFNERFLRNFNSYMSDCFNAQMSPSPFQLILFLYSHDMLIAMGPLPTPLLVGIHWFIAFVARFLLGYQATYPEYYSASKDK